MPSVMASGPGPFQDPCSAVVGFVLVFNRETPELLKHSRIGGLRRLHSSQSIRAVSPLAALVRSARPAGRESGCLAASNAPPSTVDCGATCVAGTERTEWTDCINLFNLDCTDYMKFGYDFELLTHGNGLQRAAPPDSRRTDGGRDAAHVKGEVRISCLNCR
jgi:hypothetical protein